MSRTGTAFVAVVWLSAVAPAPAADNADHCSPTASPQLRLRTCSEIIADPAAGLGEKARAYLIRAGVRLDAGAGADAAADFTEVVRLRPREASGYAGRGRARLLVQDIDGAIADFSKALGLGPLSASLYTNRGHALLVKGDLPGAIGDFSEAIRLDPTSASAFNRRGLAHRRAGNLAHAIGDYTAAIALNPVYALAYNNRAYAYEALGRKGDAITDFQSSLLLDSSLVGARDGLRRLGFPDEWLAETQRRIDQGKHLVERNCAKCHAIGQDGRSPNSQAPEFRHLHARHASLALREPLSRAIAAPHDQMPTFVIAGPEIDNVVAYINSLAIGTATRERSLSAPVTEPMDQGKSINQR